MRFAVAASGLVAVASASLQGYAPPAGYAPASNATSAAPPSYVTEVLTSYTTYCPGPTSITHNGVTYTVTEATTLTITNCPCTVTKPAYSSVVSSCSTCSTPAAPTTPAAPSYPASSPVSPVAPSSPVAPAPYPSGNATVPAYTPPATGTGAYTPPASTSPIAPGYTGAASKASFGFAGLLAAAGLVAAL
ncbi:hypothetical protein M409DRAFT_48653 [Zasmidium cellare ATCC 36951]|uniref:Mmc protein n=1 Tax=Zasmidium cellare ATCC 36951 TaxID=1080233 RepID=A0A6A6D5M8_ZASCE|nr:uncharacterized protein M409DRAFT_48653 [Zasmidium cellare ATCC 36951]KAF2173718.1 hypothetical protein M409DRAFT_48653 [Zasmidium cellare ATCC 36951]